MKKNRIIALISALLCLAMLLVSCGGGDGDYTEPTLTNPKNTDYITYPEYDESIELTSVNSTGYGEIIKSAAGLYIFKDKTKDFLNNVTETYTFYNANTDSVVKTLSHTYEDGNYGDYDDFQHEKHAPSELNVDIRNIRSEIYYFFAEHILYEKLEDDFIEDNELNESYDKTLDYVMLFDSCGTEFLNTNIYVDTTTVKHDFNSNRTKVLLSVGDVKAVFNAVENKGIRSWNVGEGDHFGIYDNETDKYGYFLNALYGPVDSSYAMKGAAEVYDKETEELVFRYAYNKEAFMVKPFVLANGNLLVQALFIVEAGDYDFVMESVKLKLQTLTVDIETGKVTEHTDFKYYISEVMNSYDISEFSDTDLVSVGFTDNVTNFISASKIEDGKEGGFNSAGASIFVMNSDLSIQHELENVNCEQSILNAFDGESIKVISGGALYVKLDTAYTMADGTECKYAILNADGSVRSYIPSSADIVGDKVVTESGVYNYDMEPVCKFNFSYRFYGDSSQWGYFKSFGEYLVFERDYNYQEMGVINETRCDVYFVHIDDVAEYMSPYPEYGEGNGDGSGLGDYGKPENGGGYYEEPEYHNNVSYSNVQIIFNDENCIAIYERGANHYVIYNREMNQLINSYKELSVTRAEDNYVVINGDFVFIVKQAPAEDDGGDR